MRSSNDASKTATRPWPDLSAEGLHFGVIDMPNGEQRLVMVDKNASWGQMARDMGFSQSRWYGVWVRSDLRFMIPKFATLFPRGKIIHLTDDQIKQQIRVPLLERRSMRMSQMATTAGPKRLSWHPNRIKVGPKPTRLSMGLAAGYPAPETLQEAPEVVEATESSISVDVAIRQTTYLGMNHLGQEVFESGDGMRFTKSGDAVLSRESEVGGPAFLRVGSGSASDLALCAAGLVNELDAGRTLKSEDFERYLRAIHGDNAHEDKELVDAFQNALDQSLLEFVGRYSGLGRDAFSNALRLHEGRPSYWRMPGTLPTPLPVSLVLQSIVAEQLEFSGDRTIIDVTKTSKSHSWALPHPVSVLSGDAPEHDIAVGGIFSDGLMSGMVAGVRVNRADHLAIMKALLRRSADGISAFVIAGDSKPGAVDSEMRRLISFIGARYEIKGLTDIDAHMVAPGTEICSRILVIGARRPAIDYTFAVPSTVPVIYDYDTLWNWSETLRSAGKDEMTFGDDGREENRWQAPYIPSSQMSEPQAMSPRNLLGPVRRALARIVETEGMGIDEYVASRLQWTIEEMEVNQYLDSEQCDAVALMIYAAEKGDGFVQADATGLGKGRTLAAMMRYYRLKGEPIVFVTEKSQLFRDIYRDIEDIGSLDLFQNPLILNNDIILRSQVGGELGRSPKKEVLQRVLASAEFPTNYSMVMATYSQFNRKLTTAPGVPTMVLDVADGLIAGTMDRHAAVNALGIILPIDISQTAGMVDNDAALAQLEALKLLPAFAGSQSALNLVNAHIKLRSATDSEFLKSVRACMPDSTQLKQAWIRSSAVKNAYFAMDESHNAAGPDSQTNESMKSPVANAVAIAYSSATFAKDTRNFGLYSRIFPATIPTDDIPDILSRGGEPLQEILSAGLAEDGRMIRREHDLSNIEFKMAVDTTRRQRNEDWANGLAQVLASMSYLSGEISGIANSMTAQHSAAVKAAKGANASVKTPTMGVQYTNFSSRFYNVSRAFMMAMNADLSSDLAIKALREGRKPVVTVENTMETVLADLLAESILDNEPDTDPDAEDSTTDLAPPKSPVASPGAAPFDPLAAASAAAGSMNIGSFIPDFEDIDPLADAALAASGAQPKLRIKRPDSFNMARRLGFKDLLVKYADNLFYAWEVKRLGSKILSRKRLDLKTPALEEGIKAVYEMINAMPDVPISPIDVVRDRIITAGFSIDELSGRKLRVIDNGDGTDSIVRMAERNRSSMIDKFNSGDLDSLVLSKSGSTGISLHASSKFSDQSQRELIEMQPAADISVRIQFWGRVNRKGQVTPPVIHMVSSGLPGEKRLMTMQNAKLRKLSANVSGNADNSAIAEDAPDILNRIGNEVCYRWLEGNPTIAKILGVDLGDMSEEDPSVRYGTRWVDSLTGKVMMLDVATQERVYAEIESEFRALIEQYEMEGRNPLKSGELDIRARKVQSCIYEVSASTDGSVFSAPVMASEIEYLVTAEGLNPDDMRAAAKEGRTKLAETWGGIRWLENVKNLIDGEAEVSLPLLLASRHTTLEAAMADEGPNAVKNYAARAAGIKSMLSLVVPGSFLRIGSGFIQSEPMYVIGLEIPQKQSRMCSPSEYKVKMRHGTTRKVVSMTISSLINMGGGVTPEMSYGFKNYEKFEANYMSPFEGDKQWTLNKVILDGNLFRAAMIADSHKAGQAITFSDEKGVWNHAILLPSTVSFDNVKEMPVDIMTPAILEGLLREHDTAMVLDSMNRESQRYQITKRNGRVEVSLTKGSEDAEWILSSSAIRATLMGPFEGNRVLRRAEVDMTKLHEFCEALVPAALGSRVKLCTTGSFRPWSIDFAQRQREANLSASEVAANAAKAGDSVEAELAAMGI